MSLLLRTAALFAIVFVVSSMPLHAQAAGDFFGPIVPEQCHCTDQPNPNGGPPITTAPSYGCVLATVQNVVNFAITIGVIAAVIAIVFAGFTWMMSGGNPEKRAQGRSMIINVVIGLVIVLSAWLIVDFVMKKLYNPAHSDQNVEFGPWHSILAGDSADTCIVATRPNPLSGIGGIATGILGGEQSTNGADGQTGPLGPPTGIPDGTFTYQGGISSQSGAASARLSQLLTCMAARVPAGVGQISSITDRYSGTNQTRISHCAAVGHQGDSQCGHTANSCHYGGRTCVGQSVAVDFGDGDPQHPQNLAALRAAATACGANWMTDNEGGVRTHLHVSVGGSCGCN